MRVLERHPRRHRRRCACGRVLKGAGPAGAQGFTCGSRAPLRTCTVCCWPERDERGDEYPRQGGQLRAAWWICDDCANVDAGQAS